MIEYDSKRWTSHLFDIRNSMFHAIFGRILACVAWSVLVLLSHKYIESTYHIDDPITIPITIHTLIGFALGTLLVFRTNTAYDRFWEGRKLWGGIVNESRNLARSVTVLFRSDPKLVRSTLFWTMAWPHAAMHGLRGRVSLGPAAVHLPEEEVAAAQASNHIAVYVAGRITAKLVEGRDKGLVSDVVFGSLDKNVQALIDYIGGCERIKNTPLPFAYMVHIRRALLLYCFTLPFAIVSTFGTGAIVATFLVAYIFFGIEEIGVEIENPFDGDENDIPLERICTTIDKNLTAMLPVILEPAAPAQRPLAAPEPISVG